MTKKKSRPSMALPGMKLGTGQSIRKSAVSYSQPPPRSNMTASIHEMIGANSFRYQKAPSHQVQDQKLQVKSRKSKSGSVLQGAMPLMARNHTQEFIKNVENFWSQPMEKPSSQETVQEPPRVSMLALLSYSTWKERIWMMVGLVFAFLTGLCLPTWLVLLARALDTISTIATIILRGGDGMAYLRDQLYQLSIAFGILGVISLFVGFAYVSIWTYTGEKQCLRIKDKFVRAALRQDAEWFDLHNREELPTAIANSMVHIQGAIGRPMADLFANFISALASLAVGLILNAPLALAMLACVPIVFLFTSIVSCFSRKQARLGSESFVAAGGLATEVISGIKTIASLSAEKWALTAYIGNLEKAEQHSIKGGILTGLMAGIAGACFYVIYIIAFVLGTEQAFKNMRLTVIIECFITEDPNCDVTGATVICTIYAVILCATFLGMCTPGLTNINLGRQAAAQVFNTINRIPVIDADSTFGETLDSFKGKVEFRKVYFAYPTRPNKPIFNNFNLTIEAGSSVAFCGGSGSGKSTIAKLLLRFYAAGGGSILIDDANPLGGLNLGWWREQIGYVAQSPIMFPGTVFYNIACGKPGATEDEVIEAAKAASAHEFIVDLPDGYQTFYSGTSVQLSGGQMQRICIARAMIRKPSILLLDEATSALDTNSERQVQDALEKIRAKNPITTVTVAHRLSTIVNSDQIAVIEDGCIAELGSHQELLAKGGIYTTLCESQGITADSTFESSAIAPAGTDPSNMEIGIAAGQEQADIENGLKPKPAEDDNIHLADEVDVDEDMFASKSRILQLNKPEWGYLAIGVVGALIVGSLAPCEAILTAKIVENFYVVDREDLIEENNAIIVWFFVFSGASLVGNLLSAWGFSVSGYRLSARMRAVVFEAIVRRNIGWFDYKEHSVGELTTRLETDAEEVAKCTGWALGYRVRVYASLFSGILVAMIFSWQIGLTVIACVPIIMAPSIVQKCCLEREIDDVEGLSPETIFENGLRGIESVQAYGIQRTVGDNYSVALYPEEKKQTRKGVEAGLVYGLSQFATLGAFAVVFFVATILMTEGTINFREFFTPILAIMFGSLGISQVNADFNAQQDGLAAAARIFKIVDEPFDDLDPFGTDGTKPSSLNGQIVFKDVTFAYPTRPKNFIYYPSSTHKGFSLTINPKDSVAFVGKSGSGKSTALQILLRFYNVSDGEVFLDGVNLNEISIPWLRQQIGYVGQNPTLFAGTIKDNILLGKPDATEQEIVTAAKAAAAHNFILKQSDGYDTDIGSGGLLLSGGQRQRIAIARAIVSNPNMLILDEATAALDNESERIVQEALDNLQKLQPRTTLMVAHRLTTVKDCNQIAVLGKGGVQELGSHSQLLEKRGLYQELWEKQGA